MKILFLHQNFPGQFVHLAPALVKEGHDVHALVLKKEAPAEWSGVHIHTYQPAKGTAPGVHPWALDLETKIIRAESVFRKCLELKAQGFVPDVVVAHPGWGESLFIKDVWTTTKLGLYCELNYTEKGNDVGFDPEFANGDPGDSCRLRLKNINNVMHFDVADSAISPTNFQADTYPWPFRGKIKVMHDGIDTKVIAPNELATFQLPSGQILSRSDEVITFANRNLEPYRGYHVFMRTLPKLLQERPNAHVVIVGGDSVSYGKPPAGKTTWKQVFIDEVRTQIDDKDWARVHFVGHLAHSHFVSLLQVSRVHVYLTYPFVASWSLLEAMSVGCAIVGSDTAPVKEFIEHDKHGLVAPFFDQEMLLQSIVKLLDDPDLRKRLGQEARKKIQFYYDLHSICLPKLMKWVDFLSHVRS
jgi:glycosyltransferase involved in cell wall biosynthesis